MSVAIIWFRKCLRIHDNQTLSWALESNQIKSILPIYIFEEDIDFIHLKKVCLFGFFFTHQGK